MRLACVHTGQGDKTIVAFSRPQPFSKPFPAHGRRIREIWSTRGHRTTSDPLRSTSSQSLRKPESRLTLCTVCSKLKSHQNMLHHDAMVGCCPVVLSGRCRGTRRYKNEACQPSISLRLFFLVTPTKHSQDVQAIDLGASPSGFGSCQP